MTGFLQAVTLFIIAGLALMTVFTVPRSHRKAAAPLIVGCWGLVATFTCWRLYLHWFNNLTTAEEKIVAANARATDGTVLFFHVPPKPGAHVSVRLDCEGDSPIGYTADWIENEQATMAAGALCSLFTAFYGFWRLRRPKSSPNRNPSAARLVAPIRRMTPMSQTHECKHEGCTCQVPGDQDYCSDQCQRAQEQGTGETCGCGHSHCGNKA